jgi:hypothetical protein
MKWLKLYPKAWRERYEEEFLYVYSKSSVRGTRLRMDMLKHFLFVWVDELAFKKGKRMGATAIILYSFVVYATVLMLTLFAPASEGYDVMSWKLFVGQVYAIPSFITVVLVLIYRNKRLKFKM